jgi:hypothetical protein
MQAPFSHLKVSRILAEDSEFVTLEVMKNDDSTFHLQQDENGNVVGGDRFLTLVFVHQVDEVVQSWDPFEVEN